jgi:hypothetical protein
MGEPRYSPPMDPVEKQAGERHAQALPPLLIIPASSLELAGDNRMADQPMVVLKLTNSIAACTFVMDLAQARQHVDNMHRAILEAQSVGTPRLEIP